MKKCFTFLLSLCLLVSMLAPISMYTASAGSATVLSVSNAEGKLGDIVDITIDVSANSYIVNGDFDLTYNTEILRYIEESCDATGLLSDFYWAANEPLQGEVRVAFASARDVGITASGTLFTLKFEIIGENCLQTDISLKAHPLRASSGSDDYDVRATVQKGFVSIIGGKNPANPIDFLNTSNDYIVDGAQNITVNADGSWTATDSFALATRLDVDIDDYPKIALWFESNVEVEIALYDEYANKWLMLESEWFGKNKGYFPAGGYNGVGDFGGIYTWNKLPMKEGNVAQIHSIYVNFKSAGTATFRAFYMSDGSAVSTAAPTQTTASSEVTITTTTTTTTTTITTTTKATTTTSQKTTTTTKKPTTTTTKKTTTTTKKTTTTTKAPVKAAIKIHPKSAVVAKGKTAKVSITATGDGLKYQWYVKEPGKSTYKAITGATKASYSFVMKDVYSGRSFYCSVKGSAGNTVKSKTAVIDQKVTITTQPKATVVAKGKSASVSVKAIGGGLKYKWYVKEPGTKTYKAIASATKATYKFTMKNAYAGRSLYCVVTDKYGNSVKSKAVVVDQKATIATQPKSVTVAKNKTAKVTLKAVGAGLKYKWYVKETGTKSFKVSSVKTATYSAKMTTKNSGRQIYCVITDKYGNTVKTKTVTLKVKK